MTAKPGGTYRAIEITDKRLRAWPLPQPESGSDKDSRGRLLIVGGASEMPGALILAANAALRVGAGKLTLMTAKSVAGLVGAAVPEARVVGLDETVAGGLALKPRTKFPDAFDAVLVGPGMQDETAAVKLTRYRTRFCELIIHIFPHRWFVQKIEAYFLS